MEEREKARELITKFTVYEWDEIEGYIPDWHRTLKNVLKIIDMIIEIEKHHRHDLWVKYWIKVKREVKSFF